ncbi:uncharacterized protein LOC117227705 isoform X1 [Megalopta genalis]|uniref:uncharacterized protein LOC117227705 isoform X1 n=2 Tax=Megalopta genalis TaxID=115081 RepID=UPI003FD607A3
MTDKHQLGPSGFSIVFVPTTTDSELDTGGTSSSIVGPPSKKGRIQKFREAWMQESIFAPWLVKSPLNNFEAICRVCNKVFRAKRADLLKHEKTVTHQAQMAISGREINIKTQQLLHHKGRIKRAELSDNANVMVGKDQSFVTSFKERNPEVVIISCICQKLNLIAIHACKFMPDDVNKLVHRIFNYIGQSGKKKQELEELQMFVSRHRMLEPSETRWLSVHECIVKLLEQWAILLKYFEDQNNAYTTEILEDLNSSCIKAYLEFLNYTLKIITRYNTIFQSKQTQISTMVEQCYDLLKDLGCNFLKLNIVHNVNLHEVDPYNEGNLLPLNEMNIGCKSKSTISECVKSEKVKQFYTNCQNFYQAAFQSAVDTLPFNDIFLRSLKFLQPSVALDLQKHENHIENILQKFKSKFDDEVVLQEWYFLGFLEEETKSALLSLNVYDFWIKMIEISDNKAQKFKNICKLALLCLTLPNSNTEIEKLFSLVNNIKTKKRNRLGHRMVEALCRINVELNSMDSKCCNYPITEEILKNFNSRMYEEDIVPHELNDIIVQDQMSSDDDDIENVV